MSPSSVTATRGGFGALLQLRVTSQYNFSGTVSFSVSGLCSGCTATLSSPVTLAPGQTAGPLLSRLKAGTSTPPGTYTVSYTATGAGVTRKQSVTVTVP